MAHAVVFALILSLLSTSLGLQDFCEVKYQTSIALPCKSPSPNCCHLAPGCRLRYSVKGRWLTELDTVATPLACSTECGRHFIKCRDKCRCAVKTDEVRSSKTCKCKRTATPPINVILGSCISACFQARLACQAACVTNKCPLLAKTSVDWTRIASGKCLRICPLTGGPLPICLAKA